ncbi:MAG TPA: T6SS effector amidase Tae4 family protein [Aquabacterium sp.]|nr:T6SS effector amidase Tae4 family protein [Aquabacterium sp.]
MQDDFAKLKGIIVFKVQWRDASGHVTLWDGRTCSDHCHFPVASEASIWVLK